MKDGWLPTLINILAFKSYSALLLFGDAHHTRAYGHSNQFLTDIPETYDTIEILVAFAYGGLHTSN
jgi:hypothetical protein